MSFGITFSATSKEHANEVAVAKKLGGKEECIVEEQVVNESHSILRLEFCPGGEMLLFFQQGRILCECQTNVAGPGFHAAVVEFLCEFARQCDLQFELIDETDYYTNRDFEQLRSEHFQRWLNGIIGIVSPQSPTSGRENVADWMICWALDSYRPKSVPETVITPVGRYPVSQFVEYSRSEDGLEQLAKEFFVWNDRERNGRFYRNSALALLWTDCYFMPSRRSEQDHAINGRIIDLLEKSAAADPTLPFPKREYLELCELHGVTGIPVASLPDYHLFDRIGYRKDLIVHTVGNLKVSLPGHYLFEIQDNGSGYEHVFCDGHESNWHELRLTAFQGKTANTEFEASIFAQAVDEPITLELEGVRCRAAYSGMDKRLVDGKPYYSVIAQAFSGKQINLMTLSFANESEKDWAFALLKELSAWPSNEAKKGVFASIFGFLSRIFGR